MAGARLERYAIFLVVGLIFTRKRLEVTPMPTRDKPDAIAMLKEDHRKVEDLFEKAEKARDEDRKKTLVQQICTELVIHTIVEEEILSLIHI